MFNELKWVNVQNFGYTIFFLYQVCSGSNITD